MVTPHLSITNTMIADLVTFVKDLMTCFHFRQHALTKVLMED